MQKPEGSIRVVQADLSDAAHQEIVLGMVRAFAQSSMGPGGDLPVESQQRLVEGLRHHPTAIVLLAFHGEDPAGILIGFVGFSTFVARPLINIHDFFVDREHRRRGIGRLLLEVVEQKARDMGCCKLTLEVEANNQVALALYHGVGFEEVQYDRGAGVVLFRHKKL